MHIARSLFEEAAVLAARGAPGEAAILLRRAERRCRWGFTHPRLLKRVCRLQDALLFGMKTWRLSDKRIRRWSPTLDTRGFFRRIWDWMCGR